jgi:two-component system sensor histidine kinase KdpD
VPTALLEFARGVNATQLVLGTSRRSRLARVFDEGIGSAVVQASGPIDVHMVTHDEARRGLRWQHGRTALARSRRVVGWVLALVLPAVCAAVGIVARDGVELSTALAGFVLATLIVALVGGLGPALVAAFLGAGLLNFFFTPPYHSLAVAGPENVITLIAMVIVAVLVALVVDRAARLAEQGARARTEAALLASYARTVLTIPFPVVRLLEKVLCDRKRPSSSAKPSRSVPWNGSSKSSLLTLKKRYFRPRSIFGVIALRMPARICQAMAPSSSSIDSLIAAGTPRLRDPMSKS